MHSSIVVSVLLGAGALAHPHFKLNNPLAHVHHKRQAPAEVITKIIGNEVEVEDIFVSTVYGNAPPTTTIPAAVAAPEKLAVAPVQQAPPSTTTSVAPVVVKADYQEPAPVVSVTPSVTPASTPAASPPASSSSNDGAPVSNGKSILESANQYRNLMGFGSFSYSSTLGANSAKTNADDGGDQMVHELNAGSMAQCIAQADEPNGADGFTGFELTYLGWLCEIPDGRLGSDCQTMLTATNMKVNYSDPGHANILRTASYTQMGCNYQTANTPNYNYQGQWICDFS